MKGKIAGLLAVVAVTLFLLVKEWSVAGPPSYFDQKLTFDDAVAKSKETGKPVFVLAGADWCGPCQLFERGTLKDRRVEEWITSRTIPVFLDISEPTSPGVEAAAGLRVVGIPAIALVKDGQAVGKHEGVMDVESLLNWLETFSTVEPAAPAATPGG